MVMNNNDSNKPASTFSSFNSGTPNNGTPNANADALKKEANKQTIGNTSSIMNQYGMAPNLSEQKPSSFSGLTSAFPTSNAPNSTGTSNYGAFKSSNFNSPFSTGTPSSKPGETSAFGSNLTNLGNPQVNQPPTSSAASFSAFKPAESIPLTKKDDFSFGKKEEIKSSATVTPTAKNGFKPMEAKNEFKPVNFSNYSGATKPASMAVPSIIEKPSELSKSSMPSLNTNGSKPIDNNKSESFMANNGSKTIPSAEEKKLKEEPKQNTIKKEEQVVPKKPKSPEIFPEKKPVEPKEVKDAPKKEKKAPKPKAARPTEATRHSSRTKKPVSQVQVEAPKAIVHAKEIEIPKVGIKQKIKFFIGKRNKIRRY
jgi:hypothetical protein